MRNLRGNDQSVVRVLNRNAVLNLLHREGPLSRVQLKTLAGLSGAAISGVVSDLINAHLIEEVSLGSSTGGRPPVMLAVKYKAHAAIGIKVRDRSLTAVLTDLNGAIGATRTVTLPDSEPRTVVTSATRTARALLRGHAQPQSRLVGVGVGLPGVIDTARGVCVHSTYLGWRDVPLAAMLGDALGAPVVIDNDVNAFATAERLFGHGRAATHFAVITVGRGIGAGLILNGQRYGGRDGGAGEFGHTITEPDGLRCECGRRGCLEAYASEPALVRRAQTDLPDLGIDSVEALLAQQDDARVRALLADAGRRVGVQLANLVNLLNPELIVIGGEGVRLGEAYFTPLREAALAGAFDGLGRDLPIQVEPWGDDAWARGAASLAFNHLYDVEVMTPCTTAD